VFPGGAWEQERYNSNGTLGKETAISIYVLIG